MRHPFLILTSDSRLSPFFLCSRVVPFPPRFYKNRRTLLLSLKPYYVPPIAFENRDRFCSPAFDHGLPPPGEATPPPEPPPRSLNLPPSQWCQKNPRCDQDSFRILLPRVEKLCPASTRPICATAVSSFCCLSPKRGQKVPRFRRLFTFPLLNLHLLFQ